MTFLLGFGNQAPMISYKCCCRLLNVFIFAALIIIAPSVKAQTESVLNGATPPHSSNPNDTAPAELGVRFVSSGAGQVEAIRFYRAVDSPEGFRAVLWNAS